MSKCCSACKWFTQVINLFIPTHQLNLNKIFNDNKNKMIARTFKEHIYTCQLILQVYFVYLFDISHLVLHLLVNFHDYLLSVDFFYFQNKIRGSSECQTIWIQIWLSISSGLIWVQTVCKGYQMGAQWLSGRVLDLRMRGCGFEPHRRHCIVVLEQDTFILA